MLLEDAYKRKDQADIDKFSAIFSDMTNVGGQTGQLGRLVSKLTPGGFQRFAKKQLERLNVSGRKKFGDKWKEAVFTDTELRDILDAPDADARDLILNNAMDRVHGEMPSTKWEKYDAVRKTLMLGNPVTQIRNLSGNAINSTATAIKK